MTALHTVAVSAPVFGEEEREAVDRVMRTGVLTRGPEVTSLEVEFGHVLARGWPTVAVNSGTSALLIGLLAAGVGPGDEIIVPSFAPAAPVNAIVLAGAVPVFADIARGGYCLSPAAVDAVVTPRTRGILAVHLFGHPAPMEDLTVVAVRHGIDLYEDASHAPGATVACRQVGAWATFAAFSLGAPMSISAGEGGMVTCCSNDLAKAVRTLRDRGGSDHRVAGLSAAMPEISAAIARVQLTRVLHANERRRMNAAFLATQLNTVDLPRVDLGTQPTWHQYMVRVAGDRDRIANVLREEWGVATAVRYRVPAHRLPAFEKYGAGADLPETERAARTALAVPVHPGLDVDDLSRVAEAVNAVA